MPEFMWAEELDPCGPITGQEYQAFRNALYFNTTTLTMKELFFRLQEWDTAKIQSLVAMRRLVQMGIRSPGECPTNH